MKSLIEDNSGGASTVRVVNLAWALTLISVFISAAIRSPAGVVPDVPPGVLQITYAFLGAKVVQRFAEKPEEPTAG